MLGLGPRRALRILRRSSGWKLLNQSSKVNFRSASARNSCVNGLPTIFLKNEEIAFENEVNEIKTWWSEPRWAHTKRIYSAEDVARVRSPIPQTYPSDYTARKAFELFSQLQKEKSFSQTFGCLDPVQVVQMCKYLSTIYISG